MEDKTIDNLNRWSQQEILAAEAQISASATEGLVPPPPRHRHIPAWPENRADSLSPCTTLLGIHTPSFLCGGSVLSGFTSFVVWLYFFPSWILIRFWGMLVHYFVDFVTFILKEVTLPGTFTEAVHWLHNPSRQRHSNFHIHRPSSSDPWECLFADLLLHQCVYQLLVNLNLWKKIEKRKTLKIHLGIAGMDVSLTRFLVVGNGTTLKRFPSPSQICNSVSICDLKWANKY